MPSPGGWSSATAAAADGDDVPIPAAPATVLMFNPGGPLIQTVNVTVIDDVRPEPDETLAVVLSNPTNATIGGATATGTIQNDEVGCAARPPVQVRPVPGGGRLTVTVETGPIGGQPPNVLHRLEFARLENARVTLSGQPVAAGQTVSVGGSATSATFTVERLTAGQAMMVHFNAVDGCGPWPTFVGAGATVGL